MTTADGSLNKAGQYKFWDKLWFVGVDGAGHLVPADQPERALFVVNSWIKE